MMILLQLLCCNFSGINATMVRAKEGAGDSVILPVQQSWEELVEDKVRDGWYQDKEQQTMWLKLNPAYVNATIVVS